MKTLFAKTLWGLARRAIESNSAGLIELASDWIATRLDLDKERVKAFLSKLADLGADSIDAIEKIIFAQLAASHGLYGCDSPSCPHDLLDDMTIVGAFTEEAVWHTVQADVEKALGDE
jgi:hypothetical protein